MRQGDLQESFLFMQSAAPAENVKPPFDPRALSRLAARGVFLGTSSWKYRGWEGLIYRGGYSSEAQFQRVSLREYTSYFPTVGVDFTYYAWPMPEMMSYLADSSPENFRFCPKVTKRITLSSFPDLPAYGKWAGKKNPDFLNADLYQDQFWKPLKRLEGRLGVVLFEFSGPDEEELDDLSKFFQTIPREVPFAVEIRNPRLVTREFYRRLIDLGLSPVFSAWTQLPPIESQWSAYLAAGGASDTAPLVGLGLLRPGRSFEEAVRLFQPYQAIREEYPEGRRALAELADFAVQQNRKAYILVANRLEGSAPHSVGGLLKEMRTLL